MSDTDSFIDEVSEEVRKERLFGLMKKWAWVPILIILLAVGGTAYNEYSKSQAREQAQAQGTALLNALETPDADARLAALNTLDASENLTPLIRLQKAAALVDQGNVEAALGELDALAASNHSATYTDLAALKAAILRGSGEDQRAELERLATPGAAYRPLALEQIALSHLQTGDTSTAREQLTALLQEPNVSQAQSARVTQVLTSLGPAE